MSDRNPLSAFGNLSPNQQIGYGCLVIILIGTAVLYCLGTVAMVMRPSLVTRQPTSTQVVLPTLVATPTQAMPTFINVPKGNLLSTPTQAPIPTREPPTMTPTVDLTNPAPMMVTTATNGLTRTPTRRATPTLTIKP